MNTSFKLSVLICTIDNRTDRIKPLLDKFSNDVEVLWLGDNRYMTIGEKRNWLLSMAKGDYVVFIDDDDEITDDYEAELLKGIESGADVINFIVKVTVDGGSPRECHYSKRFQNINQPHRYERKPNHLMCFRREVALGTMFLEKNFGEDSDFSNRVKISTEHNIEKILYFYNFDSNFSESEKRNRNER